ncbi:hypothetical protein DBV05_g6996 [Lasiodiplodia theobromae]|uniref:Uncharacterized protein n=1 Tax=Lasiodiplodia theobromae TaxID=45133 RepID=A0A5N5D9U1_9PEZI|nr:hypothetical protein DBV05_g6996 [Lasiodiplodia theobromae]
MAGFIQNYVMGMVQNAAAGAATYAITTGGRVVGDAVIGAGDLIEGAGRNVGNGIEGYIDRYGNWIRSYGDSTIAATAASSSTPVKPKSAKDGGKNKKALPSTKTPKALPAPPGGSGGRPNLKKSNSDSKSPLSYYDTTTKALPTSGVKKALPPATGGMDGLSKGQLAKLRGIRAEDLKKGTNGVTKGVGGGVNKGVGVVGGGVNKGVGAVGGGLNKLGQGVGGVANNNNKKKNTTAPSVAGSEAGSKKGDSGPGKPYVASVAGNGPTGTKKQQQQQSGKPSTGGALNQQYPKPFSTKRPDGKVVIARESKPGAVRTGGGGAGPGRKEGGGGGGGKKDEKGGFDFMRMYAEDPKKKGPGSVAGSVKTNASAAKKTAAAGKGGGEKQETSGKYDFF